MEAMDSGLLADRYELLETVGKGATGEVWKANDTLLERVVAIKLVQIEGARDPAMAERFRREGVAIAALSHPAIVQVFDTGTDERRGWLVMELLTGPNTSALIKERGPVSFAVGLPLLAQVASGLQAAHDQGVTHRDVKPANIVLHASPDADGTLPDLMDHPELGRPVLVDFGIARLVDESGTQLTRPATAIGTAAYMSPEQARGQQVDPPSDVYSLACVAYHLFLGRPPFLAESSLAIAHAQAFDQPTPMIELDPSTPPALNTLLLRMLSKDPATRPTAAEVSGELLAIAADPQMAPTVPLDEPAPEPAADLEAVPSAPPEAPPTPRAMRHAGRILIWLLLFSMAIALAYSWLRPDPPAPPNATVTMVSTAVQTHTVSPGGLTEPPSTPLVPPVTEPPPSTAAPTTGPTSQASAPPATQPTNPPASEPATTSTAAATTSAGIPINSAAPTTAEPPAPPPTSAAPEPSA